MSKEDRYLTNHFKASELACRCGCETCYIKRSALDKLEHLRILVDVPVIINSACRCPCHNARVGGAPLSQHRSTWYHPSTAFDIRITSQLSEENIVRAAKKVGFKGIGIYKTFVHIDDREKPASW